MQFHPLVLQAINVPFNLFLRSIPWGSSCKHIHVNLILTKVGELFEALALHLLEDATFDSKMTITNIFLEFHNMK